MTNYFLELILFINLQSLEDLKNIFSFVRLHKKKYIVLLFKKRNFFGLFEPYLASEPLTPETCFEDVSNLYGF